MKKFFYVAAAFLAAGFVSCSENNNGEGNGQAPVAEQMPILFNLNNGNVDIKQNAAATRGTGAIGANDENAAANIWRGEELNVYMFNKGTLTITQETDPADATKKRDIFANTVVKAPGSTDDQTGVVYADYATANGIKYYPMSGEYDFFAYHADDAAKVNENGEAAVPALNAAKTQYVLPVQINGTQDLMVAKAAPTVAQTALLPANSERFYSAYSARKGVHPHFKFEHLLTRLVFSVKANTENETNVSIDSIKITDAKADAELVVAWIDEPASVLVPAADAAPTTFALMQKKANETEAKALVKLESINPKWDAAANAAEETPVGESMLLMSQETYNMQVYMSETDGNNVKRNNVYTATLSLPVDAQGNAVAFQAGKEYHIKFTVYGLEEIKLELELVAWDYTPGDNDVIVDEDAEEEEEEEVEEEEEEEEEVEENN